MKVVKKAISMPPDVYQAALKRCRLMGYTSFSGYLTFLVRQDLESRPNHVRIEQSSPRARGGTAAA